MRTLNVFINQRRIGELAETESIWRFRYDDAWANSAHSFDLAPALKRAQLEHIDGASDRPVQWYFDNLLPEEGMRQVIEKEANTKGQDAFALLEYLGAESAGSLTLLPPGGQPTAERGLRALTDEALSKRIRNLPNASLAKDAAKHMSIAGAQHKLPVVYRPDADALFEPVGATPSTHILKPNHPDSTYASSVINEYFTMRLARQMRLVVPQVWRRYTPLPVYLVERFDRRIDAGGAGERTHIIDACQLLNRSFQFKYQASLNDMQAIIGLCRQRAVTRQRLFRWLTFNVLIGNHDNHLKNLSFAVSEEGIDLAPHYALLSTGAYHTKAMANEGANWPYPTLAIELPGANSFHTVSRRTLIETGLALGLKNPQIERELDIMAGTVEGRAEALMVDIEERNQALAAEAKPFFAGELALLRTIIKIVIREMAVKLRST